MILKGNNHRVNTATILERAVLISIILQKDNVEEVKENLNELNFLAVTAGAEIVSTFTQKLQVPNNRTFIGSGKLIEIKEFIQNNAIDLAIFDEELSPAQIRNIENVLNVKIIDRTNLIIDIFAKRAKTAQAKTQVELAQCEYLLTRLTRLWTHLSRQKGGIGLRGPGESEIETDRRMIRKKISILKKQLEQIEKQGSIQRKNRTQKARVALVGYTNAGKSTLMNLLSKANVFSEDKLFATVDTTVRNVIINNITFLLSDTVGFIRKLPHRLIESFKSTLEEAREADILLHIIDISHTNYEKQIETVNATLNDIGANGKPILMVFNKIDKLNNSFIDDIKADVQHSESTTELLNNSFIAKNNENVTFISAKKKQNVDDLRAKLLEMVAETYKKVYPHYPLKVAD